MLTYLEFNCLDSFLVYRALSVGDFAATNGNRYIHHSDLAIILLDVRIYGAVFHIYAQEQQHNVLVVGQTGYKIDLSKLPKEDLEMYIFFKDTSDCKIRVVPRFTLLQPNS